MLSRQPRPGAQRHRCAPGAPCPTDPGTPARPPSVRRFERSPLTTPPRVSVVVPHYNDLRGLDICLTLLEQQTVPRDQFEIIVADNASPQGAAVVEAAIAGRARLVVVTDRGAGPARNGGVAQARGEILAFVDSDCQAEPQWLAEGVAALANYDFVGGSVSVLVDDMQHMTPPEAFERVFAFDMESYVRDKGFAGSGNLFCPKAVFERVGGFRAAVSEDTDWSYRATAAGFRLGYCDAARVGHPARRTWDELLSKWKRMNSESFGLFAQGPGGRARWLVRCLLMPASALAHTPKVFATPKLETMGQRLAALGVLYRLRIWRMIDSLGLLAGARK
jgi:cellulose synthase/poly-beta-1,6-N-acetylglucosamine synthase-like glycosyltransferase